MSNHQRWVQQVYAACCADIGQPGIYGIGVRLLDERGEFVTVVDVMCEEWNRLGSTEARFSHIEGITP